MSSETEQNFDDLRARVAELEGKVGFLRSTVLAKDDRIAKLEAESAQWQESCGQNYVRATEAESEFDMLATENAWLQGEMAYAIISNEMLRTALECIARAAGEEACPDGYSAAWHARKALEEGNGQ